MAAVSTTVANLSREFQPSGPASASGSNWPLPRASFRQLCRVASEIPSSRDSCRKGTLFGGCIFFRAAALRSFGYATSSAYPAHLKNRDESTRMDNYPDTGGLRPNQEKVRSTTQRRGSTTKPVMSSLRLTISILRSGTLATA